nr:hypothetical protein RVX_0442 [Nitratidesulfovibrio sp. HK-II]
MLGTVKPWPFPKSRNFLTPPGPHPKKKKYPVFTGCKKADDNTPTAPTTTSAHPPRVRCRTQNAPAGQRANAALHHSLIFSRKAWGHEGCRHDIRVYPPRRGHGASRAASDAQTA